MNKEEYKKVFELERDYWWFKAKRNLLVRMLRDLKSYFQKNDCLLDIGCGTGENMKKTQEIISVVGIDMSIEAINFCKEKDLNRLINGDAKNLPLKDETFRAIVAMDLLEHTECDTKVLKELHRVCKKNGFLITHVPAFQFLWSDHDEAVHHKRRYSKKEFIQKLHQSSFEIQHINYRLFSLFPLGVIHRLLLNLKRKADKDLKITTHRPKVGKLINRVLELLISLEDIFVSHIRLPFGMSIICVALKKG